MLCAHECLFTGQKYIGLAISFSMTRPTYFCSINKHSNTHGHIAYTSGASGKESVCQCRRWKKHGFDPWVGKSPWSRKMAPHSSILAWKIPWTRSLVSYSSWRHRVRHDWAEHTCSPCRQYPSKDPPSWLKKNISHLLPACLEFWVFSRYYLVQSVDLHLELDLEFLLLGA